MNSRQRAAESAGAGALRVAAAVPLIACVAAAVPLIVCVAAAVPLIVCVAAAVPLIACVAAAATTAAALPSSPRLLMFPWVAMIRTTFRSHI
ncbi:hypothetical protein GCM10010298_42660 [Streptomyces microflavus]|nr:hypothetical protein GCM10010298_42660 [Streptomyces microflavus]